MHHGRVTVFECREAVTLRKTGIDCSVTMEVVPTNPSRLAITFECEQCDEPFELRILQHEGETYVAWR